jgi:hypothetical protein
VMVRSLVAGTTSAIVGGIACGVLPSMIWGTASLPFIFGSCLGFTLGSIRWYILTTEEALLNLHLYPALLRLHLRANYPREERFRKWDITEFRPQVFRQSWALKSMLVSSFLTAQPALDDINSRLEEGVVGAYLDGHDEQSSFESVCT